MAGHRLPSTSRPRYARRGPAAARRPWKAPLVGLLAAVFAAAGGIALAATNAAPAESAEVDCTLVVPANPLSAAGLATPYQLLTPCQQADDGESAFVQATVVDPATGKIFNYNPVVVDQGSTPAAAPVLPRLPAGAVVGLWFGFNGDNLTLRDSAGSLTQGGCVNGLGASIFGQFAFCNATKFFTAANAAISAGLVSIPDVGTAKDGQRCLSTRDFGLVDQDQSDNVTTSYLVLPNDTTAQNTAANRATLAAKGAKVQSNGSDNGLLDSFVDPALGCAPWRAPDLADPGAQTPSLALNELQAAAHQAAPVAVIPTNDPMALVDGKSNVDKTNLYRAGVDQAPIDPATETPTDYCRNLRDVGVPRIAADKSLTVGFTSPDAGSATNLFTFLAARVDASFSELDCADLGVQSPVIVVTDANGVAIAASFTSVPTPGPSTTTPRPSPTSSGPTGASPTSSSPAGGAPVSPRPSSAGPSSSATGPATGRPVQQPSPPVAPTARTTTPAVRVSPAATRATTAPPVPATKAATTAAPPTGGGNNGGTGNSGGGSGNTNGGTGNTGGGTGTTGGATAPPASPTASPADAGLPVTAVNLSPGPMPLRIAAGRHNEAASVGGKSVAKFAISGVLIVGGLITFGLILNQVLTRRRRYRPE